MERGGGGWGARRGRGRWSCRRGGGCRPSVLPAALARELREGRMAERGEVEGGSAGEGGWPVARGRGRG